jgi:hypothetical protein
MRRGRRVKACYSSPVKAASCFDTLSEVFARDLDLELLRRARAKTPTERIQWLERMQEIADQARRARADEAARAAQAPR